MKRILLILSFLFFALWVAALFDPNRTMGIHIALIVALLFFIRSLIIIESPVAKEAPDNRDYSQSVKKQYQDHHIEQAKQA